MVRMDVRYSGSLEPASDLDVWNKSPTKFLLASHLPVMDTRVSIHQSLPSHKMLYNVSRFSNFELPLLVRNSTYVAHILCGLSYNV